MSGAWFAALCIGGAQLTGVRGTARMRFDDVTMREAALSAVDCRDAWCAMGNDREHISNLEGRDDDYLP
jgi:hypothetical protein